MSTCLSVNPMQSLDFSSMASEAGGGVLRRARELHMDVRHPLTRPHLPRAGPCMSRDSDDGSVFLYRVGGGVASESGDFRV